MRKLRNALSLAGATLMASPIAVFAQDKIDIPRSGYFQFTNIGSLISNLISLILIGAAVIFFFMLVLGGIQWMLSGGDKAGTESARGRITAALIGLLIVFAAWAITRLLETFLGVQIISGGGFAVPKPQ